MSSVPTRAQAVRATLAVTLAASSWGCWSLFLKPTGLSAWETSPILFLVTWLVLLPFRGLDGVTPIWDRTSVLLLFANAATDTLNVIAFFAAMGKTTVSVAVLTHYLAPLLVALFAPLIDRERVRGALIAAVAATLGLALVLEPWSTPTKGLWFGAALGTLSAFGYAANLFVVRRLSGRIGSARAMCWHSLIAAAVLAPFADRGAIAGVSAGHLAWLVAGVAFFSAGSGWLFLRGLRVIGSTRTAVLAFMEPLVAVLVGWLAWSEPLGPPAIAGGLMILGAGAWISLAPRTRVDATS